jgi:hypothetical protein
MKNVAVKADGRAETAAANRLDELQAEAEAAVRHRYRERLATARGLRRLADWISMRREIRHARRRVEDVVAPRGALYIRDLARSGDRR